MCRFGGKDNLFIPHFLCGFEQIYRMVGNSFKITEQLQEHVCFLAVAVGKTFRTYLNKIGCQHILITVTALLIFFDAFGKLGSIRSD